MALHMADLQTLDLKISSSCVILYVFFQARTALRKNSFQTAPFYKIPELSLRMITDLFFNSKIAHLYPLKVTTKGVSKLSLSLVEKQEDSCRASWASNFVTLMVKAKNMCLVWLLQSALS